MSTSEYNSTLEYGLDMNNISIGIMENGFVRVNLDYPRDLIEQDMISRLLQKYKKLWLCGDWQSYKIPDDITHLCFDINGKIEDSEIMNKLPASLEFLCICNDSFNGTLTNLPPNLKHLEIHAWYSFTQSLDLLPIGIETLVLNSIDGSIIRKTTFPPNLKKLVLETKKMNGDDIPWHLSFVEEWSRANIPILRNLPASLKYLYIHGKKGSQKAVKEYLPNVKIIYLA